MPYLLTGDRYYAEEMAFWANYGMLRTDDTDGIRGSGGILAANGAGGYAWALRNLADAAAYYPDASPVRAYLAAEGDRKSPVARCLRQRGAFDGECARALAGSAA